MPITLNDLIPVSLCLATQDLFDTKRFQANFCDNLVLRAKDKTLEPLLLPLKREINSYGAQKKFIEGHKVAIINNLDKILALVSSRYSQLDYKAVQEIVREGKELIRKVLFVDNFEQINRLEPIFRTKITLPIYSLFIEYMKKSNIPMV